MLTRICCGLRRRRLSSPTRTAAQRRHLHAAWPVYSDEPSSRHPLQPPGPDYRIVEPSTAHLPELPETVEEFDESDPRYDVLFEIPAAAPPQDFRSWSEKVFARKSWRERWRDRYRENIRGYVIYPYPEPVRIQAPPTSIWVYIYHLLYVLTLPIATILLLVREYMEEVVDYTPFTARPRLNAISPEWVMSVGESMCKGIIADHGYDYVADDDPRALLVQRVFARILMANGLEDKLDWNICMLDVNMPHVYAAPTGRIVVCAGLLPVAASEDGIAHLLSHEIAHIVLGHHTESMGEQLFWPMVLRWLATSGANHESFLWRYASRQIAATPYSWLCESEADELGLQLMARACFSPSMVPSFSDRLYRMAAERGPYFSAHPIHDSKQEELQKYLKLALEERSRCNCPPERQPARANPTGTSKSV